MQVDVKNGHASRKRECSMSKTKNHNSETWSRKSQERILTDSLTLTSFQG